MKTTILIAAIIFLSGFILRKDIITIINGTEANGKEEKKAKKMKEIKIARYYLLISVY